MNAYQPLEREYLQPTPQSPAPKSKRPRPQRRRSYPEVVLETSLKLTFKGILSLAAIAAVVKLLPLHDFQQAKLQEIDVEVRETQTRVDNLSAKLSRNFDPQQTKSVMQQQAPKVSPNQYLVYFVEEKNSTLKH
jgi:hypothetical protein